MKPETAAKIRAASEAATALLTLLTMDENDEAISMVANDDTYNSKLVPIMVATYAASAIKLLAKVTDSDPMDLVRSIAINSAQFVIDQEKKVDGTPDASS